MTAPATNFSLFVSWLPSTTSIVESTSNLSVIRQEIDEDLFSNDFSA